MKLENAEFRGLKTAWLSSQTENAPLLIFLHGFPDSPEIWSHQTEYFRERYHVLCPFSRGVGPSEGVKQNNRYGWLPTSLDWLQLINNAQQTPKQKIILVGHDMGAAQAWHLAPLLGDRLEALICINGLSAKQMLRRLKRPSQALRSWYIYTIQIPGFWDSLAGVAPKQLGAMAYSLGGLKKKLHPEKLGCGDSQENSIKHPLKQYRAFLSDLARQKAPDTKVHCPVLLLWGNRDPFLIPPTAAEFQHSADELTIRILDGGHWLQRESPVTVNQAINAFLGDLKLDETWTKRNPIRN